MFLYRARKSTSLAIWPTFVDALSTVLMTIVFVMMTVLVSQIFLVETINDRDTELADLQSKVKSLEEKLEDSIKNYQEANLKIKDSEKLINEFNIQISKLTQELSLEKDNSTEYLKHNINLKNDLSSLDEQLKKLQILLDSTKAESNKKEEESKKLQVIINNLEKEIDKHNIAFKVEEFRSEFFAQLQKILGERNDIRIVGDRFIFQSEVLFAAGSAELGNEGKKQLNELIKALKDIEKKIPSHIQWILRVDGHTDRRPINSYQFPSNWELSSARAIAVVQYIIKKGIDGKHLVAAGFGEHQPLSDQINRDLDKDRRIEFKLDQR